MSDYRLKEIVSGAFTQVLIVKDGIEVARSSMELTGSKRHFKLQENYKAILIEKKLKDQQ